MRKICFITTKSITIKAFLVDFANFLVLNFGFDVTFICSFDEELFSYCSENIHFIPVNMKRGVGFDGPVVIRRLKKIFKQQQFDIIQYATPNAAFYASIASRETRCKHRLYCQWGVRYMGFNHGIKRCVFKWIEKAICSNSTEIESESFSLYKFSIKEKLYPEKKASVIWNGSACGVDLDRFNIKKRKEWRIKKRKELGIPDDAFVFGYVGRLTKDKGINELIKAFLQIQKTNGNAFLLLCGSFDNRDSIEKPLKEWLLTSSRVLFIKWTDKVEEFFSVMDVFVSLSYREGFGLVVIEAAAMGVPSIVTDCPGQKDTIEENKDGWLVPVRNVEQVVEVMNSCLDQLDLVQSFGMEARKKVEEKYEQRQLFNQLAEHRIEIMEKDSLFDSEES